MGTDFFWRGGDFGVGFVLVGWGFGLMGSVSLSKLRVLDGLRDGFGVVEACRRAGVSFEAYKKWRQRDAGFGVEADLARRVGREWRAGQGRVGLTFDPGRRVGAVLPLVEGRLRYVGRPTPAHHVPLFRAWEDRTNLAVVCLGPPGSGKDTTAGDIVLLEAAFFQGRRHAWVMESKEFSQRRMERISPYLFDPRAYDRAPQGPGCVVPSGSLIDDFGPFRWKSGMVYPDGSRVPEPTWTKQAMYFLGRDQEADPNLWATGIGGATYGARIDTGVTSDIFTPDNQGSPVVQADQLSWLFDTFFSRLDEAGRYLHLGTRVGSRDNQREVLGRLIGEASVVEQDGWYTKYANGVATVIYPAIQFDGEGREVSYWPEMFPLDGLLVLRDGSSVEADSLTAARIKELAGEGARRVRGLREIRERDPSRFATMYQQSPPESEGGEFTREMLDRCDDPSRTLGVAVPGRPLVLGVDPARAGGAGWVLWEFDPESQVLTLVDLFYGERLGIQGIREKLLVRPLSKWWPRYCCYEYNHEAAVLEHPDVVSAVDRTRTELVRHFTAANRTLGDTRVAAMAFDLRSGKIRFPSASPQDRDRVEVLKQHALNWDARSVKEGRSTRGGPPDHLWMAAWVGWVTVKQRLEQRSPQTRGRRVPQVTLRRWGSRFAKSEPQAKPETDLVSQFFG